MNVQRTTTWSDNQVLTASALNGEFNHLLDAPAIVNADISASAAIAYSKLSLATSIVNADISATAAIATSKINATFPTGAIVGTTDTQTLTNKTITSSKLTTQSFSPGAGATQNIDLSLGAYILITMPAGNITLTFTNGAIGQCFVIRILEDSVGSRTVTYPAGVTFAGGNPTNSGANKVDCYGFMTPTSTTAWDGCIVFQNR